VAWVSVFSILIFNFSFSYAASGIGKCKEINSGNFFWWFDQETGRTNAIKLLQIDGLQKQIDNLENQIKAIKQVEELSVKTISVYKDLYKTQTSIVGEERKRIDTCNKRVVDLEKEKRGKWYLSPFLWTIVGAFLGGFLVKNLR